MREDTKSESKPAPLIELGAASELTQGTFMPRASEQVLIKDYFDEP